MGRTLSLGCSVEIAVGERCETPPGGLLMGWRIITQPIMGVNKR